MGQLVDTAKALANKYGLDPAIVCAVCEQESGWNPWATRYEPAFEARYVEPIAIQETLTPTEIKGRSTSYGLMQVMGQVAREIGFTERFLTKLCDPATGLDVGCRVLVRKLARASGDWTNALLLWNGGGNPHYAAEVLARVVNYR